MSGIPFRWLTLLTAAVWIAGCSSRGASVEAGSEPAPRFSSAAPAPNDATAASPLFHVPHVDTEDVFAPRIGRFYEMAIFWFGQVGETANYADVRLAYNDRALFIHLAVIDRRLWADSHASRESLGEWDGATLLLRPGGPAPDALDAASIRLTAQASQEAEPESRLQSSARAEGGEWTPARLPFLAMPGWRGDSFNTDADDQGWTMSFTVPFDSLGLDRVPSDGETWAFAVILHDRDSLQGAPLPEVVWPSGVDEARPASWGRIEFGLPGERVLTGSPQGMSVLRNGENGIVVEDGAVGGHTVCGEGLDPWTEWGDNVQDGFDQFNIQNQRDIADWPCFSKYYITFPLDSLPPDQTMRSAALTLHQFGGSGTHPDCPSLPNRSLIQVFTVADDWDPRTLSWNNAPAPIENVGRAWVEPLLEFAGWPGIEIRWDVTDAAAQAYARHEPLRLALYSADPGCHSGKYFSASETGDWNSGARPALEIEWGTP